MTFERVSEIDFSPLPSSFYRRDSVLLAQELLNCLLVRETAEGLLVGRISETEAYCEDDPASHAFGGVRPRNRSMFAEGGTAYVYLSYGVHHCMNAVAGEVGVGAAVLLRSVEPLLGIEAMAWNRGMKAWGEAERVGSGWERYARGLCGGPGKLGSAYALSLEQDGHDLRAGQGLWIAPIHAKFILSAMCVATPRIGISKAKERLWRFHIENDPFISRR